MLLANKNKYLKEAFTIAEILITLAVIGIVAAMTIPSMLKKTNNTENINSWKNVYSEISSAWFQVVRDYGGLGGGLFTSTGDALHDSYGNLIIAKLKYVKKCTASATPDVGTNPCWHNANTWHSLNKIPENTNYGYLYSAILQNGAFFVVGVTNRDCTANQQCFYFAVDVNGKKGPNVQGKDIFHGGGRGGGAVVPHVISRDASDKNDDYNCVESSTRNAGTVGQGCSKLALACGDIDYTKGICKQ